MRWYKCLLIFFISYAVQAQEVWPGDVNNNGVVNGADLLYLGLVYGEMGPPRLGGNERWEAQTINLLWGRTFSNGLDYAYADCNGDGRITEEDIDDVIKENWGLMHGVLRGDAYSNGAEGLAPPLILEPDETVVTPGAQLNINLRLGTADWPVDSFYGVAFSMSYNTELIDENAEEAGFDFEIDEDSWIASGRRRDIEYLFRKDVNSGKAEVAITRIDQQAVERGFGRIGQFSVVVEDIIVGAPDDSLIIQIDSVFLIDHLMNVYPVVPDTARIYIQKNASPATEVEEFPPPIDVKVYPNPAKQYVFIESKQNIERIRVFDAMGRLMPITSVRPFFRRFTLPTASWPVGLYYLELNTLNHTLIKKVAVVSDAY